MPTSAKGQKRKWSHLNGKSLLPPEADIDQTIADVSVVPEVLCAPHQM